MKSTCLTVCLIPLFLGLSLFSWAEDSENQLDSFSNLAHWSKIYMGTDLLNEIEINMPISDNFKTLGQLIEDNELKMVCQGDATPERFQTFRLNCNGGVSLSGSSGHCSSEIRSDSLSGNQLITIRHDYRETLMECKVSPYFLNPNMTYSEQLRERLTTALPIASQASFSPEIDFESYKPANHRDQNCNFDDGCWWSEGVGEIGYEHCSATLISPDTIVTAAHCISQFFPGTPYRNFFSLPAIQRKDGTQLPRESLRISHVITGVHDPFLRKVDWAFIKLADKAKYHQPRSIKRSAFSDDELYHFVGRNRTSSGIWGQWKLHEGCKFDDGSLFSTRLSRGSDATGIFIDCPIGPGNSGSGLFDTNGELVAVVSGQMNMRYVASVLRTLMAWNLFIPEGEFIPNLAFATNFSCIPDLGPSEFLPGESCDTETLPVFNILPNEIVSRSPVDLGSFDFQFEKLGLDNGAHIITRFPGFQAIRVMLPSCLKQADIEKREIELKAFSLPLDESTLSVQIMSNQLVEGKIVATIATTDSKAYEVDISRNSHLPTKTFSSYIISACE